MKSKLQVPFLADTFFNDPLEKINFIFQDRPSVAIVHEPWPLPGVKPEVSFKIAYGADALFLNFNIKEEYFKATYKNTNDPVFKDSCVEFFISLDNNNSYYNFEFNALGTIYAAYGIPHERELLDEALIKKIKINTAYKKADGSSIPYFWGLTVAIPFSLFSHHSILRLEDTICHANFYKCGDDLPEPHFFCWSSIIADKPDFHLPQYFGELLFK